MSLVDRAVVKSVLGIGDGRYDVELDLLDADVAVAFAVECRREFIITDDPATTVRDAPIGANLYIPDHATVMTVTAFGVDLVVDVDYTAIRQAIVGVPGTPFIRIQRRTAAGYLQAWTAGQTTSPRGAITITGLLGWAAIPTGVTRAALEQMVDSWKSREQLYSRAGGVGAVRTRMAGGVVLTEAVRGWLAPYRREAITQVVDA